MTYAAEIHCYLFIYLHDTCLQSHLDMYRKNMMHNMYFICVYTVYKRLYKCNHYNRDYGHHCQFYTGNYNFSIFQSQHIYMYAPSCRYCVHLSTGISTELTCVHLYRISIFRLHFLCYFSNETNTHRMKIVSDKRKCCDRHCSS